MAEPIERALESLRRVGANVIPKASMVLLRGPGVDQILDDPLDTRLEDFTFEGESATFAEWWWRAYPTNFYPLA